MTLAADVDEQLRAFEASADPTAPGGVVEARIAHDRLAAAFNGTGPQDVRVSDAGAPRADGSSVPLRVYQPPTTQPACRLLWIHGGGFVFGSLDSADSICRRLSRAVPATVVSVGYRLGPEHTAAESCADVDAAWAWMLQHAVESPRALPALLGGDSAGGTLAALLALRLRDSGRPVPRLQLLAYPVTALDECLDAFRAHPSTTVGFPWGVDDWLAGQTPSSPSISPLRAALHGSGQVHLVCGTEDALLDQDRRYLEALRSAGVVVSSDIVEGMPHGFFPWECGVEESIRAFDGAVAAIHRVLEAR